MKTAIITGVSGQDGVYLAKFLLQKEYRVVGTLRSYRNTNYKNFKYLNIENDIILEEIDLLDISNVIRIFQKYKPNEIYNLAAQSSVGLSYEQPIGTFYFNTASVNNILEAIRLTSPFVKMYQASSSEMYGSVSHMPIDLNTSLCPISPYGISKAASYLMTKTYRDAYGVFVCNGILFNHESFLRSDNFFIKKVIKNALMIKNRKIDKLVVGNLAVKRDFGYAPKYVEAMWMMMQLDRADDFIICSGVSIKLRDIVEYVFDKIGINKKLIFEDNKLFRPNEISDIYGNNLKAKNVLKWEYNHSFFDILDLLIEEEMMENNEK
ncbi:GDP-mannose 4,6-dehydratase [Campylobacter concisus]|jgi:GDP-mannose 4,6-dehydratase|uniref:GDP-mannose 4,6-dehydratase n=1 Tax=Campylobacter concisus TaxID=199 RepID=UPI000CD9EA7C|nr:GDP-mannose 4,6-dehydratase [Campylobacter concisus]